MTRFIPRSFALLLLFIPAPCLAQPEQTLSHVAAEIPEEVLETEIILEARSPIDGRSLSPADYAQLQDQLQISAEQTPVKLAPKLHRAVVLLRLRKVLRTLLPF